MARFRVWLRAVRGCNVDFGKVRIRQTDSTVATAIRTVVVLAFSWLMVFVVARRSASRARRADAGLSHPLRPGHGRKLAVLF